MNKPYESVSAAKAALRAQGYRETGDRRFPFQRERPNMPGTMQMASIILNRSGLGCKVYYQT